MSAHGKHYMPQIMAHWFNLISMTLLIVTGFYIHHPFAEGLMGTMRAIHYVAAFVFTINIVWRLYYAFFGKHKDYHEFTPEPKNILSVAKYYAFMGPHPESKGKYNALQKLAYIGIPFLIIYQVITGFAMGWPDGMLAGFVQASGGLANVRALHYVVTWVFISFTLIHVYLVFFEQPKQFLAMFFGKDITEDEKPVNREQAVYNVQSKG